MGQNNLMNPAMLQKRIRALEYSLQKQFALNDAAAHRLMQMQDEIAQKGAFVVALVQKLGGRFEATVEDLANLEVSNLRVHYSYPTPERPSFIMVLGAEGDARSRQSELEEKLRRNGLSDEEIEALKAQLDAAEAEAVAEVAAQDGAAPPVVVFPGDLSPEARRSLEDAPGEIVLVGPDGKPPEA